MKLIRSLLVLGVLASLIGGCASEKQTASSPSGNENTEADSDAPEVDVPDEGYVPPGSGPGEEPGEEWEYGGAAKLEFTSLEALGEYTGRPMNKVKDARINVNLIRYGSGYGGEVTIAYEEEDGWTGTWLTNRWSFTSAPRGMSSKDKKKGNKYNVWFVKKDKFVYHGFFEDFEAGAIVLVIDDFVDLGDGAGPDPSNASGRVYFKNFELTYAPHPPTFCWFVSLGPYDCRAWKSGEGVKTTKAINPDSGYQELGSFSGLNLEDAFNGELEF